MKKTILSLVLCLSSLFFTACRGNDSSSQKVSACNEDVAESVFGVVQLVHTIMIGSGTPGADRAYELDSYTTNSNKNILKFIRVTTDNSAAFDEVCTEFKQAIGNKTCQLTRKRENGEKQSATINKNFFKNLCASTVNRINTDDNDEEMNLDEEIDEQEVELEEN